MFFFLSVFFLLFFLLLSCFSRIWFQTHVYQAKGCDSPWLHYTLPCCFPNIVLIDVQYEDAAFSKASPDFDFVIIMDFYQLCWQCIILCFKFPRLQGGCILLQGFVFLCESRILIFLTMKVVKTTLLLQMWFHSLEILNVPFFFILPFF